MTIGLENLAREVETSDAAVNEAMAEKAAALIADARPRISVTAADLRAIETLLHLVDQILPGWSIVLSGKAYRPDGHWSCTLRESTERDRDEYLGRGKGPDLTSAILAALLRVMAYETRDRRAG